MLFGQPFLVTFQFHCSCYVLQEGDRSAAKGAQADHHAASRRQRIIMNDQDNGSKKRDSVKMFAHPFRVNSTVRAVATRLVAVCISIDSLEGCNVW